MEYLYCSTATRLTRRFPWHVLSKQRSCAPFSGILINTDVGNPTVPFTTAFGRQASFIRQVGTHNRIRPYKGIRIRLFYLRLLPPLPIHLLRTRAPAPKPALPTSTSSSNVRSGRQVDGLLHYGGPCQKAEEGRILVQRDRAPASCKGAASPHPRAPSEGRILS